MNRRQSCCKQVQADEDRSLFKEGKAINDTARPDPIGR